MRGIILPVIMLLAVGVGAASWHFSATNVAKRQLQAILEDISATSMAMDRPKLLSQVDEFLAPNGKVTLDVKFSIFAMGSSGARGWQYEHNREQFKNFIVEMTDKVNTYGMRLCLLDLVLDEKDNTKFTATVSASGFSTGASMMMGRSTKTRIVISGECTLTGTTGESIQVALMHCPVKLNQQADLSAGGFQDAMKELKGLKP